MSRLAALLLCHVTAATANSQAGTTNAQPDSGHVDGCTPANAHPRPAWGWACPWAGAAAAAAPAAPPPHTCTTGHGQGSTANQKGRLHAECDRSQGCMWMQGGVLHNSSALLALQAALPSEASVLPHKLNVTHRDLVTASSSSSPSCSHAKQQQCELNRKMKCAGFGDLWQQGSARNACVQPSPCSHPISHRGLRCQPQLDGGPVARAGPRAWA